MFELKDKVLNLGKDFNKKILEQNELQFKQYTDFTEHVSEQNSQQFQQYKNFTKQIAFNAIPHIDVFSEDGYTKEELKMTNETKKILDNKIDLTATCVRLPISVSHSESVNLQFEKPFTLEKVRDALNNFEGCKQVLCCNFF